MLVGRPLTWGLTLGGAEGAQRVLEILLAELRNALALTGCPRAADLDRELCHHAPWAGSATQVNILVTGVTGYVGSLMAARLVRDGHTVRGFARRPERVTADIPVVGGDAITGAGLDRALDGIDVAYFLIHSMEPSRRRGRSAPGSALAAETFAAAAGAAGRHAGSSTSAGWCPAGGPRSAHLASRMAVEEILRAAVPDSVALRASIVIGARSRSFRFLVRLVERLPVLAVPAWRNHRTAPVDERDIVEMLAAAATSDRVGGHDTRRGRPRRRRPTAT